MSRPSGLEPRLKAWAYAGAATVALSVLLCIGLISAVWVREVRQVRREMDAYTRAEALALGRNLLYDLASDTRVLRTHYLERSLLAAGEEGGPAPGAAPDDKLLALVERHLELPDTQIWLEAKKDGVRADLPAIAAARRAVFQRILDGLVVELQEDLWARVTFSDHLRGVRLASAGGLVQVEAGEEVPGRAPATGGASTVEVGAGRLLVTLPLYVETRHWGRAYLLMDRGVLLRVTDQLTRSVNFGAVVLSGLLGLLLVLWSVWAALLLGRLRREVVEPVVSLARRMEAWAPQDSPAGAEAREPRLLAEAFGRLQSRVSQQQEQLLSAQKLGLLERLGAGLSHEMNNALNPARLRLEEIALSGRAPDASDVQALREYLESAQAVLRDFSLASRPRPSPPRPLSPSLWLGVARRLVEPHFEKGPSLAWEVRDEGPEVLGEEQALVQVAVNLLLNAREAAEQRGEDGVVRVCLEPVKGGARLAVEDNGPGIPPEIRDRLFEPFVTSKAGGSGLGLFVVETLTRRMGGQVTLSERPGGGTVASVTLPSPGGA